MFIKSFTPQVNYGSSGSRRSGSSRGSRADIKGSNAILTRPTPKQSRADIKGSQAILTKPKPRQSRADIKGSQAVLTRPKELFPKAPKAPSALNDANGVGRRSAPVNLDIKSTASSGSTSGGTGGRSGKIKASKVQEENVTVRKASRGTSKYKKNKLKVAK